MKTQTHLGSVALICIAVAGLAVSANFAQSSQTGQKHGERKGSNTMSLASNKASSPRAATSSTRISQRASKTPMQASPAEIEHMNALMRQGNAMEKQARTLMGEGDLSGAERTIKAAIVFYEGLPETHGSGWQLTMRARQTLGDIYLKDGQYQQALEAYGVVGKYTNGEGAVMGPSLNLDVALAYCGLGDYASARRYYSDKAITQYSFGGKKVDPSDLPGTASPQALEASILLARGIDAYFQEANADATDDFAAADRLAPGNPLLHYYWSDALLRLNRYGEAIPQAEIAATHAHWPLAEFAHNKLNSARSSATFIAQHPNYVSQHPDQAPKFHN